MAVKLFSLAKELNVGVNTIADILLENGAQTPPSPTSRLSNEDLNLILKGLSGTVDEKLLTAARSKFLTPKPAADAAKPSEGAGSKPAPASEAAKREQTESVPYAPTTTPKIGVKIVGEIGKPTPTDGAAAGAVSAGTSATTAAKTQGKADSKESKSDSKGGKAALEKGKEAAIHTQEGAGAQVSHNAAPEKEHASHQNSDAALQKAHATATDPQAREENPAAREENLTAKEGTPSAREGNSAAKEGNKTSGDAVATAKGAIPAGKGSESQVKEDKPAHQEGDIQKRGDTAHLKEGAAENRGAESASEERTGAPEGSAAEPTPGTGGEKEPKELHRESKAEPREAKPESKAPNSTGREENTAAAEEKQSPAAEEKPAEKEASADKSDDGVFRIRETKPAGSLTILGKIDLGSLNDKTRPHRKGKDSDQKGGGGNAQGGKGEHSRKRVRAGLVDPKSVGDQANKKEKSKKGGGAQPAHNRQGGQPQEAHKRSAQGGGKGNAQSKQGFKPQPEEDHSQQVRERLSQLERKNALKNRAQNRRDKRRSAQEQAEEARMRNEEEQKTLKITEFVTVSDLANMMQVPVNEVIGVCMSIDMMVSINQRLDEETIKIVAEEFGYETDFVSAEVIEAIQAEREEDNPEDIITRIPIVTVMGHVDHGKTSLLDHIRNANVIAGEAGGITQHIGAYNVTLKNGRQITFLDTPGHEAFTAMRARGAQVTDIAIIIVAADDQVQPQTVEAINHAAAAGVPMIFAINKIDKEGAQPDKVREQLAKMNYLVEEWGGKYQCQEISAKKGTGVFELLEKVLLEADMLELKGNPKRHASGTVLESSLDKGRGYVSNLLIQNGTLRKGDIVLAGQYYGRIKAMTDERDRRLQEASVSMPVQVLGFNGAPSAGDSFYVLDNEQEAREIAHRREQLQREQGLRTTHMTTLEEIGRRISVGNFQEMNLIVKGDVDGSVEALSDSLIKLSNEEVQVKVIHKGVGQISESDVVLAAASQAVIIGFQVRPSAQARKNAEQTGVEIKTYSIIYDAIEALTATIEGMLAPEIKETVTATLEVLQVFKIGKVGTIAGCMVTEGKIKRTDKVRVIRNGIVIHTGELDSLKRFKDDAKEVVSGLECGLNIKNYNDLQEKDVIESYEETEVRKKLS